MRYHVKLSGIKLSGTLGDDSGSWDDPASDADTGFLGLGSNALAYGLLAAGLLLVIPQMTAPPKRVTRSPRRKLTNGVKGKRRAITLSRQSDGSYA